MTLKQLYKKISPQELKIGKEPFVVLSMDNWYEIEDMLWQSSAEVQKDIAEARREIKEGKYITFDELKKELNLK